MLNFKKFLMKRVNKIINSFLQKIAKKETNIFIKENIPNNLNIFNDKYELLRHCISNIEITNGFILELGVYMGNTINFIASLIPNNIIYGFDSFEGLPENWRFNYKKGRYNLNKKLPRVTQNVFLIEGYFNESLIKFKKDILKNFPISFIHFDADLYLSTKQAFDILSDNIVDGTIIQFDEYFNYYGWKNGEHKAFIEYIENKKNKFKYLGYTKNSEQLAIKIINK